MAEQLTLVFGHAPNPGDEIEDGQLTLRLEDAASIERQRIDASFHALISHELRTPLAVVMGALHALSKHGRTMPDDVFDRILAGALEEGSELTKLIENVLDGLEFDEPRESIRL